MTWCGKAAIAGALSFASAGLVIAQSSGGAGPVDPKGLTPAQLGGSSNQVTSGSGFNPAISVIPDVLYYSDSASGDGLALLGRVDGFGSVHDHAEDHAGHSHGLDLERGFNLREVEVAFSGAVDPYFDVWAILAVGPDGAEIEETFVQTRRLPGGLKLKLGKFYSDVGYLNKQHPHQWDFVDTALPYQLGLGGSLNETGLQLTWLPKMPFYALFGVEALQGANEAVSSFVGPTEEQPLYEDRAGPRLLTGFLKVAPDLGFNHALQVGAFGVRSLLHQQEWEVSHLEGKTWLLGTDLVYKYDAPHLHGKGDLQAQAEYLYRVKDLASLADPEAAPPARHRFVQDGLYAQVRYGFAPRFTAAVRFDVAGLVNRLERSGGESESWESSQRWSAAIAFNPTEFSRIRVQGERCSLVVGGERKSFNQVFVQVQVSLGVHGAHRF